jgi:hypothetical protein
MLTPHRQIEAIKRRDWGEKSLSHTGRSYNVARQQLLESRHDAR